jgi:hypothetical protein
MSYVRCVYPNDLSRSGGHVVSHLLVSPTLACLLYVRVTSLYIGTKLCQPSRGHNKALKKYSLLYYITNPLPAATDPLRPRRSQAAKKD